MTDRDADGGIPAHGVSAVSAVSRRNPASPASPASAASSADPLRPLLLAASQGCGASFALLYRHTHDRLFAVVLRIVRHRAEAEEVLQDIYVKVWSRSLQFDPARGHVVYWLAGIARCAAIDTLRRASRRPREAWPAAGRADPYDELVSADPGPDEQLARVQTRDWLGTQLSTLPAEQRESLVMAFFDGLTHAEIAHELVCPLGTIKSRIRRAMTALQPALQAAR